MVLFSTFGLFGWFAQNFLFYSVFRKWYIFTSPSPHGLAAVQQESPPVCQTFNSLFCYWEVFLLFAIEMYLYLRCFCNWEVFVFQMYLIGQGFIWFPSPKHCCPCGVFPAKSCPAARWCWAPRMANAESKSQTHAILKSYGESFKRCSRHFGRVKIHQYKYHWRFKHTNF